MVTLREKYPLENRKPLKKSIPSTLIWMFILILLSIGIFQTFNFKILTWILIYITLAIVIFIANYVFEVYYLKLYYYDLIGKNLIIKKGVFSRQEIILPINRLQDVYVDQDILDRIFGLYDVHVSTATTISGNLSHIDGLNMENSEIIKNIIINSIQTENV